MQRGGARLPTPYPFIYHFLAEKVPLSYVLPFVFRIAGINVPLNVTFKANKTQATEIKRALTKQGIHHHHHHHHHHADASDNVLTMLCQETLSAIKFGKSIIS